MLCHQFLCSRFGYHVGGVSALVGLITEDVIDTLLLKSFNTTRQLLLSSDRYMPIKLQFLGNSEAFASDQDEILTINNDEVQSLQ